MHAELLREPLDGPQGEVPLTPLDRPDEGAMPAHVLAERFLRVAHLPTEPPHVVPDDVLEVTFHGRTPSTSRPPESTD